MHHPRGAGTRGTDRRQEERGVTCVVGELDGVDDVDVHPEGLEREHRALVPDVPIRGGGNDVWSRNAHPSRQHLAHSTLLFPLRILLKKNFEASSGSKDPWDPMGGSQRGGNKAFPGVCHRTRGCCMSALASREWCARKRVSGAGEAGRSGLVSLGSQGETHPWTVWDWIERTRGFSV